MLDSILSLQPPTPNVGLYLLIPACLWCGVLLYRLYFSPVAKLPGPWYLKLSSLFFIYHEFRGRQRLWIHSLHQRYGSVIALGPRMAHFSSAAAAKTIYNTGSKDYAKTEYYNLFRQEGHINLFTALDSKTHSEIRRQIADRYANTNVINSKVMDAVVERARTFVDQCTKEPVADVYFYLHAYALDCVTSMLFHPHATRSLDESDHKRIVHYLSYRDGQTNLLLSYYAPLLSKIWQILRPLPQNSYLADRLIREYVSTTFRRDDLSPYTVAARLQKLEHFDTDLAISECLDHLGAGLETTGDTLCWLMWELSQPHNYARMDKLHAELKTVSSTDRLDSLPYLKIIVQEALRLYAPGTQSLPRHVPEEGRIIDEFFIPGRTIVGCQSHTLHRDPTVFPDGDKFIPERWLDKEGSLERQRLNMSFGFGARTCIGKHLAEAEMRILLHTVYSRYRTRPAKDMTASMEFHDSLLTSRPEGKACRLTFELYE